MNAVQKAEKWNAMKAYLKKNIAIRVEGSKSVIHDLCETIRHQEAQRRQIRSAALKWEMTIIVSRQRAILRRTWTAYRVAQRFLLQGKI